MTHTATPFRWEQDGAVITIYDAEGRPIAEMWLNGFAAANVEFIVRACNAHDDLVKALEMCFDFPADIFDLPSDEPYTMTVLGLHLHLVRDALAKAKA